MPAGLRWGSSDRGGGGGNELRLLVQTAVAPIKRRFWAHARVAICRNRLARIILPEDSHRSAIYIARHPDAGWTPSSCIWTPWTPDRFGSFSQHLTVPALNDPLLDVVYLGQFNVPLASKVLIKVRQHKQLLFWYSITSFDFAGRVSLFRPVNRW